MTNTKSTKRALLSSLMAMILCIAMLAGTTFAWFTDSVTSSNNIIVSGNLDVELEYYDATAKAWTPVAKDTNLFSDQLWEPGHTQVVYLKVSNLGSLALKYQLGVNVISKSGSVDLSQYIEFGTVESAAENFYTTRGDARNAITNAKKISEGFTKSSKLFPVGNGTSEEYVALVVYMPESVGNDANVAGGAAITLGVNLAATQHDAETDSFGSDYDKDLIPGASYAWTPADFTNALAAGGHVVLMEDVQLEAPLNIDKDVTLDLNGNTVTGNGSYALNFTSGNSTVIGGTVQASGSGKNVNAIWTEGNAVLNLYDVECLTGTAGTSTNIAIWTDGTSVLNVYSGTYNNAAGGPVLYSYGASTINIYGGHFYTVGSDPWAMINDYDNGQNVITVYGGCFVNFDPADENDNKKGDGAGNSASYLANGYKSVPVAQANGDTWFYVIEDEAKIATSTDEISAAIAAGTDTVYLSAGNYELKGNQADGASIVGLGDGIQISNLTNFAGNGNYGAIWKNMTFENVIFTEKVYTMADGAQSVFKNCTFKQGFRGGYSSGTGVVFDNCTFYANSESYAMHFQVVKSTVKATNCNFVEGTVAFGNGSGSSVYPDALITFTDCTFSGESTRDEYFDAWASCVLTNCTFTKATEIWHQQPENGETVTLIDTVGASVIEK